MNYFQIPEMEASLFPSSNSNIPSSSYNNEASPAFTRRITANSPKEEIFNYFQGDEIISLILKHNFQKVGLQFSDEELVFSSPIYEEFEKRLAETNCILFVIADSSFARCCIDTVSSEHVGCDFLVHFGHSCLSPCFENYIPVYLAFGKESISNEVLEKLCSEIEKLDLNGKTEDNKKFFLIVYEDYYFALKGLFDSKIDDLRKEGIDAWVAHIPTQFLKNKLDPINSSEFASSNNVTEILGREVPLPEINSMNIIYLGHSTSTFEALNLNYGCKNQIYRFDVESLSLVNESTFYNSKFPIKRYSLIEKAKEAETFGILYCTLDIPYFDEIGEQIKKYITMQEKKYYELYIGKLNHDKIANFTMVFFHSPYDLKRENSIKDPKDFFRPIVTPYELLIALECPYLQWESSIITDYFIIIQKLHNSHTISQIPSVSTSENVASKEESKETSAALLPVGGSELSNIFGDQALIELESSHFKGLDINLESQVKPYSEGKTGIASNYTNEHLS